MSQEIDESEKSNNSHPANEDQTVRHAEDGVSTLVPPEESMTQKMLSTMSQIAAEVSFLNRTFETRISYDEAKEKAFDRLYAELDEQKKNSAFEHLRPLYIDIILLFDRIENIRQNVLVSSDVPSISDLLKTLNDELLEILYRRGIELITITSPTFDPSFQLALSTEPTAADSEHNQVARVVRRGFKYKDRILRSEEVIVKKFRSIGDSGPVSAG